MNHGAAVIQDLTEPTLEMFRKKNDLPDTVTIITAHRRNEVAEDGLNKIVALLHKTPSIDLRSMTASTTTIHNKKFRLDPFTLIIHMEYRNQGAKTLTITLARDKATLSYH